MIGTGVTNIKIFAWLCLLFFPVRLWAVDSKYIILKDGVPVVGEYLVEFSTFSGSYVCVTQGEADALSAKLTASGHAHTVKKMVHDATELNSMKSKQWRNFDELKKSGLVNGKPSTESP